MFCLCVFCFVVDVEYDKTPVPGVSLEVDEDSLYVKMYVVM